MGKAKHFIQAKTFEKIHANQTKNLQEVTGRTSSPA